jgi:hypothetical protein
MDEFEQKLEALERGLDDLERRLRWWNDRMAATENRIAKPDRLATLPVE